MARIETIDGWEQINVTASVGANGAVNNPDDVIVVKALLTYSLSERIAFRKVKFPVVPNGTMNENTVSLIKKYQEYTNRGRKHRLVTADGRIDRAVGNYVYGKKRLWTILSLNSDAMARWNLSGRQNGNYIADLCANYSQVRGAIENAPVGSLGLSLEGSSDRGVGSLGLSLE